MRANTTKRRVLFTRPHDAIAVVIAGLFWIVGCKQDVPLPKGAAGVGGCLINDVLWAQTAFAGGELHFVACYDVKHMGLGGSSGSRMPDGSHEANVNVVAKDGFTLNLKYVDTRSAIEINGKQYPHAAGRIFYCNLVDGKVLVDQFLVAPELMKGDWPSKEGVTKLVESIPELRQILKKAKPE